jgi:RNA polymerase sigma-70 factor (ECF subfamily)
MDTLDTLYRQHASAVFRFAWGLCGDRHDAEDIVSETFVRVLTKAPRIETQTALAYLLAIARNVCISGWRKRRRNVPLPEALEAAGVDPVDRLDSQERLASMLAAIGTLPEGERAALLLRVDHELSYDDIASALGITVSAAKVRVHRARLRLAAAGAPRTGDAPCTTT